MDETYKPIESYGVIGNSHTCGLVAKNGDLDFMSYPRLDSPSIFAALLDVKKGGFFRIGSPKEGYTKSFYYPDTNVLITRLSMEGVCEIWDYMPLSEEYDQDTLVRSIRGIKGKIPLRLEFRPRFDFARSAHKVEKLGEEKFLFIPITDKQPPLMISTNIPVRLEGSDLVSDFEISSQEEYYFVLENADQHKDEINFSAVNTLNSETVSYWRRWVNQITYKGRWHNMVVRSALTLKLLCCRQYGSIVAAATLGLPEVKGGRQNWDYRYVWIRDSSFVVYCFISLGLKQEAQSYMRWVLNLLDLDKSNDWPLQTLYRLDGDTDVEEVVLDHFEGYKESIPVRLGNAAVSQLQIDIYGELMDAALNYDKHIEPIHYKFWLKLSHIVDFMCENWSSKDNSIWEFRGQKREFLYSRLMSWVCIDRAIKLARRRSLPGDLDKWRKTRDQIYFDIFKNFWNPERKAFVQSKDSDALDASVLMMPLVGFISPQDPYWISTFEEIEENLIEDTFVHRYLKNQSDVHFGFEQDNTFSICTFWYANCLARSGRLFEARFAFEKMLGYSNHLGLYSEELGINGEMLGNFPQALTHLGLISTAYQLNQVFSEAGMRQHIVDL